MNDSELTIYMVTHKEVDFIPSDRTPIFVGNGNNIQNFLRDNIGDNIALKNSNYCELTAYYWIWKNDHHSQYVAIEHYRRFFMKRKTLFPTPYTLQNLRKDLTEYGAITVRPSICSLTIKEWYCKVHCHEDYNLTEEAIKKLYPSYLDAFYLVMEGYSASGFNMLAMKKESFDAYCKWLFEILEYVETRTNLEGRSDYQKRAYGFIAERLLNVWLSVNTENIKYLDVYYLEKNRINSVLKSLKHEQNGVYIPKKLG